jgi:hypothetical protein
MKDKKLEITTNVYLYGSARKVLRFRIKGASVERKCTVGTENKKYVYNFHGQKYSTVLR